MHALIEDSYRVSRTSQTVTKIAVSMNIDMDTSSWIVLLNAYHITWDDNNSIDHIENILVVYINPLWDGIFIVFGLQLLESRV